MRKIVLASNAEYTHIMVDIASAKKKGHTQYLYPAHIDSGTKMNLERQGYATKIQGKNTLITWEK